MILSIPLFSPVLLAAAVLVAIGMLLYPFSARLSVIGIGAGSIVMGIEVLLNHPVGLQPQSIILFGSSVIVGAWMALVGLKKPAGKGR
ncbi:MAG: hypothetical protein ACE14P_06195 [Methanotrichaceae archaeon]